MPADRNTTCSESGRNTPAKGAAPDAYKPHCKLVMKRLSRPVILIAALVFFAVDAAIIVAFLHFRDQDTTPVEAREATPVISTNAP